MEGVRMPYCSKCGVQVRDDDLFCRKCGSPVNRSATEIDIQSVESASYKSKLIIPNLPIVREYNDKYENSSIADVLDAFRNGDIVATYELAYRYRDGEGGVTQDQIKSLSLYKEVLSKQNNAPAFRNVGVLISDEGVYGEGQKVEGIPYLEAAMELGDSQAAIELGFLYKSGEVVSKNNNKAIEFFKKAIDLGEESACYLIGQEYSDQGKHTEAKEYYEKALAYENVKYAAALELGIIYENGTEDIDINLDKALSYYELAYENRDKDEAAGDDATFMLAKFLFKEKTGKAEDERAYKLFIEDNKRGFTRSNLYLGYYYGYGIQNYLEPDTNRAFEYLDDVRECDKADALFYKGSIYLKVLNNQTKAEEYLSKAIDAGSEDAKELLKEVKSKGRLVCPKCGAPFSTSSKFCSKCGTALNTSNDSQDTNSETNKADQMVRLAGEKINSSQLREAKAILEEAYKLFPDNNKVIDCYTIFLSLMLSVQWGIGNDGDHLCKQCCDLIFELTAKLKQKSYRLDHAEQYENDAHYGMGRYYKANGDINMALNELKQVNIMLDPFAAFIIYDIHVSLASKDDNDSRRNIEKEFVADVELLKKALNSNHFANDREKCLTYLALYSQYSMGSLFVPKNVNYAYDCVKKANDLRPDIAGDELKRFTTDSSGNLVYNPD